MSIDEPAHDPQDRDFWLNHIEKLELNVLSLMALHGSICLALRHPKNKGESRAMMIHFVRLIGRRLVELGAITNDHRRQAEAGFVIPWVP